MYKCIIYFFCNFEMQKVTLYSMPKINFHVQYKFCKGLYDV